MYFLLPKPLPFDPNLNEIRSHGLAIKQKLSRLWWRHQMETFSALLAIYAGNSQVTGEYPAQRPLTHSFDIFFDLRLNKRLSKQSWGWWFETPSCPLWPHCNDARRRWKESAIIYFTVRCMRYSARMAKSSLVTTFSFTCTKNTLLQQIKHFL